MSDDAAVVECWKITDCDRVDRCLVSKYEGKACWEVASLREEYQGILPVCEDCLVHITISKNKKSNLTDEEIDHIWKVKGKCTLIPKCEDCEEEVA
jgi:hypothetical protein